MPFQNYRAATFGEAASRVNEHRKGRSRPGRSRELPRPPCSGTRAQTKHGAREPFITPPWASAQLGKSACARTAIWDDKPAFVYCSKPVS